MKRIETGQNKTLCANCAKIMRATARPVAGAGRRPRGIPPAARARRRPSRCCPGRAPADGAARRAGPQGRQRRATRGHPVGLRGPDEAGAGGAPEGAGVGLVISLPIPPLIELCF